MRNNHTHSNPCIVCALTLAPTVYDYDTQPKIHIHDVAMMRSFSFGVWINFLSLFLDSISAPKQVFSIILLFVFVDRNIRSETPGQTPNKFQLCIVFLPIIDKNPRNPSHATDTVTESRSPGVRCNEMNKNAQQTKTVQIFWCFDSLSWACVCVCASKPYRNAINNLCVALTFT